MKDKLNPNVTRRLQNAILYSNSLDDFKTSHAYNAYIKESGCDNWLDCLEETFGQDVVKKLIEEE